MRKIYLLFFFLLFTSSLFAQRSSMSLKEHQWRVWLDDTAEWENDILFAPNEENIADLASQTNHIPTCGWVQMYGKKGTRCNIPASVEEYFAQGDPLFTYHGVSWFWTEVFIPKNWKGRYVTIDLESTRLRCELFVNEQLAGYDIVGETPWKADLSNFMIPGKKNRIALRITNPGGHRGWEDFPNFRWGKNEFPSSHDFGGIGGDITLTATSDLRIDNIFVKNILPANSRNLDVQVSMNKKGVTPDESQINVSIISEKTGQIVFSKEYRELLTNKDFLSFSLTVPEAELWDINTPNLYKCLVSIKGKEVNDSQSILFGFRTFEVKKNKSNDHNFYFNGKRIVHISAIDWGYYSGTGLYPTPEMAYKSVKAAKDIGHNGLNFHRCIGAPEIFNQANMQGLFLYEEPGGFHAGQQGYNIEDGSFMAKIMEEKCRRMAIRDRNHPSLIIHNLCNEDNYWNSLRERCMKLIHENNPTVMVSNSSGGYIFDIFQASPSNLVNHIRPYETEITNQYEDNHTVEEYRGVFYDPFLFSHTYETQNLQYWGEVHCYGGPDNWYQTFEDIKKKKHWDINYYCPLHKKLEEVFADCNLAETGSRNIHSPSDISCQAGRGLMYINGRASQNLLSMNSTDGFAINGWSGTSEVTSGQGGYWSSALLDGGRNLKGVADDYAYWSKPLQICIKRMNGTRFTPSEVALFDLSLINHGIIAKGDYSLKVRVKDGDGEYVSYEAIVPIKVGGGDIYAQHLKNLPLKIRNWKAGYITLEASLMDGEKVLSEGAEQIILSNPSSFSKNFIEYTGAVVGWDEAKTKLKEAKAALIDYSEGCEKLSFICAGQIPSAEQIKDILRRVREDGTTLLIPFDKNWGEVLYKQNIILEIPNFETAKIDGSWMGNGWGYIDYFVGNQAVPSGTTIGTNSWELGQVSIEKEQKGFWPLKANPQNSRSKAYGMHMARPDILLITLGELNYGKGKIILNSSYQVNENDPFCDLLFFNMLTMGNNAKYVNQSKQKSPYFETPQVLPGRIDLVNFDNGGEGIGYHDEDDTNLGKEYRNEGVDISSLGDMHFVGWTSRGEWLEYTIDVKKSGTYSAEFHYATTLDNCNIHLLFDGIDKSGSTVLPQTGDWFAFRHHNTLLKLDKGIQTLRVYFKEGGCNISSVNFKFLE